MKATELLERIESNTAPLILDARSEGEYRKGHVPGAINAPVRKILLRKAQLPEDKSSEIVTICMHGQRAKTAKFLLGLYGYRNTDLLDGFLQDWMKADLPLETEPEGTGSGA